jgi:hypothetical protein
MQKFNLGNVVATPAALHELAQASINPLELIVRHSQLDQGCLCAEDQALNQRALIDGSGVFSAFIYAGTKFYVITEAEMVAMDSASGIDTHKKVRGASKSASRRFQSLSRGLISSCNPHE